jgi:hypothetical protein
MEFMNGTSLLAILRLPFGWLERFLIKVYRCDWDMGPWKWNNFSSEVKDALSNIIHSSTLKTLVISGIIEVPSTIFHTAHFTTLELDTLSPDDFVEKNSSSLTRAASKGVAPMACHTAVDRCVWHSGYQHYLGGT